MIAELLNIKVLQHLTIEQEERRKAAKDLDSGQKFCGPTNMRKKNERKS